MCTSLKSVWDSDVYVGSNLVGMYPKCGGFKMLGACSTRIHWMRIFHLVHVNMGNEKRHWNCFNKFTTEGILWNSVTFGSFATVG